MSESNIDPKAQAIIDIFDAFDANISKTNDIVKKGLCDIAVIMIVSALEVLLTDLFQKYKVHWFTSRAGGHINAVYSEKRLEVRKEIRRYFKSINAYDDFIKNYYVYQDQIDPDIESAYETLFSGSGRSRLNFQNLKEDDGSRKAYMLFLNIDLMEMLDSTKNVSCNRWKELNRLFDDRHAVIHKGANTSFSQDQIIDILKSLIYMRNELAKMVMPNFPLGNGSFYPEYPADKDLLI